MFRFLAWAAMAAGSLGSLIVAVGSPPLEFANEHALTQRAAELRAQGPAGLQTACARLDALMAEHNAKLNAACEQMRRCIDLVAGQRDGWMSRLYWYTDLDEAKAAAAACGKPILSLRMLGRLTDEYSCANSRFFRTALYVNESVGNRLRENFVLHWQSVRPVPRVTIDFGDGRKLERTMTGNSAHYVLDASGRPLDVLPGLYGPQAFEAWLVRCEALASAAAAAESDDARDAVIAAYHRARRDAIDAELRTDLAAASAEAGAAAGALTAQGMPASGAMAVETGRPSVAAGLDDDAWRRIAALPQHLAHLDLRSQVLMRRELPDAAAAARRAMSKSKIEDPLVRVVQSFEASAALDAVKNEFQLHRQIHAWYADGEAPRDFNALNERVYAELFLTPSSDPWLGLAPADAYTGLVGGGLSNATAPPRPWGAAE